MKNPVKSQKAYRVSRGPRRSEESHKAILDAAEELLSEAGASALTFEAIARRAKAGKPTIYRWWPTKVTLLLELYNRQKSHDVAMPNLGSLREDLTAYTRSLWRFWRETNGGVAFAALIAEAQLSKEGQRALAMKFMDGAHGPSVPAFERAITRGELSKGADLMQLRKAYVATNWFHLLCDRLEDDEVDSAINALVDGMLKRD